MTSFKIAVLPGDGIGQSVTEAVLPIFDALKVPAQLFKGDIGWQCWLDYGDPVPEATWRLIQSCDTVLLGAITSKPPREAFQELPDRLKQANPIYRSPVIQLRQELDLYVNVRPVFKILSDGHPEFKCCIIRENTEGLYSGFDSYPINSTILQYLQGQHSRYAQLGPDEISCALRIQTKPRLERLIRFAFDYADKHQLGSVTLADKPNVLRQSGAFTREIFEKIASEYQHIEADCQNVDALGLRLVKKPQHLGVVVAENMFGDILSDVGAGVMGGLGLAPSANLGTKGSYYEPVHGSAPRVNRDLANPGAMFLTVALMLENQGWWEQACQIRNALVSVVHRSKTVTYDLGGSATTNEMAQAVLEQLNN